MRYLLLSFWGLLSITVNSQSVITDNMVLIPAGEFVMGKDMESQPPFSPAHKVKVNAFYMDTCEVTNRQYLQFCKETATALPEFWNTELFRCGDAFLDYPVVGVNWFSAMKYAEWAGKRLPTEAEWEYAARGGLIDKDYPNGNNWNKEKASQGEVSWENLIEPVGQYESNGYGLYDMGGNVWEWVADRYSDNYYTEKIYDNPQGPDKGSNRVIRGGSWHSGKMCKRVYYRNGLISNWSDFAVGFRCVKDADK